MKIGIRRIEQQHIKAAAKVNSDVWHATYEGRLPDEYLASHDDVWFTQEWQRFFGEQREGKAILLGAFDLDGPEAKLVGVLRVGEVSRTRHRGRIVMGMNSPVEISNFYVAAQDKGAGTRLLRMGEEWMCRLAGDQTPTGVLWVADMKTDQWSYYTKRGWEINGGHLEDYAGQDISVVRFTKALPDRAAQQTLDRVFA